MRLNSAYLKLSAYKTKLSALSLWLFVKEFDSVGKGIVQYADFRRYALELWSSARFDRNVKLAEKFGYVKVGKNTLGKYITYISVKNLCLLENIELDNYFVNLPVDTIATIKTLKTALYNIQLAGHKNPISQETLKGLTLVNERTQRRLLDRNITTVTKNALDTGLQTSNLEQAREVIHPGCYAKGETVLRPLPNSYTSKLVKSGRNKAKRINKSIRLGNYGHLGAQKIFTNNLNSAVSINKKNIRNNRECKLFIRCGEIDGIGVYKRF